VSDQQLLDLRLAAQLAALRGEQLALPPQIVLGLLNALTKRPWES
jgi:hypothetical protein